MAQASRPLKARAHRLAVGLLAVTACMGIAAAAGSASADKNAGAPPVPNALRVTVAGADLPRGVPQQIVVTEEVGGIAVAEVTLTGDGGLEFARRASNDADLAVSTGPASSANVFKGEVVGVEPAYQREGESVVVLRALNRLHRLTRGRKSRTFTDVSDADLVRAVATENGLQAGPSNDLVERYPTVVQHDETDLDFLRARAARIGHEVLVEDTTLLFRPARDDRPPVLLTERRAAGGTPLRELRPRLSSSASVQEVTVRGFDPNTGEAVEATARAPTMLLVAGPNDPDLVFGRRLEIDATNTVASAEAALELARATLRAGNPLSAEAACDGDPRLEAGGIVVVAGVGERFDGKYHVTGATHRFSHPGGGGGYRTLLRLAREDGALYRIPEIDDEVLVTFEHGDIRRPVVIGSLW